MRVKTTSDVQDDYLLEAGKALGSEDAVKAAIKERDRRRDAGEDVAIFWDTDKGILSIGPRIQEESSPSTPKI